VKSRADQASSRAVFAEFQLKSLGDDDDDECWSHSGACYSHADDACATADRALPQALLQNTLEQSHLALSTP
jgi:hypothetical protein